MNAIYQNVLLGCLIYLAANHNVVAADQSPVITIETKSIVAAIRNQDVEWDGNYLGLRASLRGASKLILENGNPSVTPFLIKALDNESQFVAAHVILVMRAGKTPVADSGTWEGLSVQLNADGTAKFDFSDAAILKDRWKAYDSAIIKPCTVKAVHILKRRR